MEQIQEGPHENKDHPHTESHPSAVSRFRAQAKKLNIISNLTNKTGHLQTLGSQIFDIGMPSKEKVAALLLKDNRTEDDAKILYKALKHNAFFETFLDMDENLETKALLQICKQVKYERFSEMSVICKQGDPSNGKMYIVFSGELNIYVKEADAIMNQNILQRKATMKVAQNEEEADETKSAALKTQGSFITQGGVLDPKAETPSPVKRTLPGRGRKTVVGPPPELQKQMNNGKQLQRKESLDMPVITNPKLIRGLNKLSIVSKVISSSRKSSMQMSDLDKFGVVVDTVSTGGFFGERALITDQPRGATVVAMTRCELLVFTKELFMSLKSKFDKKKNQILDFMKRSIPTLDQIASKSIMEKLAYLFKEQRYEYGQDIVTEDTKGDMMYLLYDGECEIVKNIKVDKTMTLKSSLTPISPLIGIGKTFSQQVMIYTIPKGTFFGDEILFQKTHKYRYTVRVSCPRATVFAIHRSNFAMRFPHSAFQALKKIFELKLQSHEKRLAQMMATKFKGYNEEMFQEESPKNIMNGKSGRIIINTGGNQQEPTKVIVVTKEVSPYYNAFTNNCTNENNLERMLSCPTEPNETPKTKKGKKNMNEIYDPRGIKKVIGNNSYQARSIRLQTESFSGEEDMTHDYILTLTNRENSPMKKEESTERLRLNSAGLQNTQRLNRSGTWNEYFVNHKVNKGGPQQLRNEERRASEKDLMMEHARMIQADLASEHEDRRFKIRKMLLEGAPGSPVFKQKGNVILKFKSCLEKRKNRYEKKSLKINNTIKNLIQMQSSTPTPESSSVRLSFTTNKTMRMSEKNQERSFDKKLCLIRPLTAWTNPDSSTILPSSSRQIAPSPFKINHLRSYTARKDSGSIMSLNTIDQAELKEYPVTEKPSIYPSQEVQDEPNKTVRAISHFSGRGVNRIRNKMKGFA